MDIAQLVEQRIEEAGRETIRALASTKDIGLHRITEAANTIRPVYAGMLCAPMRHWANFAKDIPLEHQLLIGPPAIIDLAPVSESEFEKLYGITIEMAVILAESGAIIPNIYYRDPAAWSAKKEIAAPYNRLLSLATVNGKVTDTYLELRQRARDGQNYAEFVASARCAIATALSKQPMAQLRELANKTGLKIQTAGDSELVGSMAEALANNWAYLKALAGDEIADGILSRLGAANLHHAVRAIVSLRTLKHQFASPLTAALGGQYIWPNFARDAAQNELEPEQEIWQRQFEILKDKSDLFHHILNRALGLRDLQFTSRSEISALGCLLSSDFRERTQDIWDIYSALCEGNIDAKFNELERLYVEINRIIGAIPAIGKRISLAGTAVTGASFLPIPDLAILGQVLGYGLRLVGGAVDAFGTEMALKVPSWRTCYLSGVKKLERSAKGNV